MISNKNLALLVRQVALHANVSKQTSFMWRVHVKAHHHRRDLLLTTLSYYYRQHYGACQDAIILSLKI